MAGGLLLLAIILTAVVGPTISRGMFPGENPLSVGSYPPMAKPSPQHPLGTDPMGRDALAFLLNGVRQSLAIGVIAGLISAAAGAVVGFTAGYLGGRADAALRVVTDMFLVIPTLPILLILALYIGRWNLVSMALLLAIFGWPFVARTVRAQVLSLRERPYVDLAHLSGENTLEIIFLELMPALLPYIFLSMSGSTVGAIFSEAGLQLIGVGVVGLPTLGYMVAQGFRSGVLSVGLQGQMIAPLVIMVALFLSLNLINIGVEERFNPRLRAVAAEQ
jgi:peptide/nickel transport system permease protein